MKLILKSLFFITLIISFTHCFAIESVSDQERIDSFISSYFGEQEKKQITLRPLTGSWSFAKLYHIKKADKQYVVRFQNLASSACSKECYMLDAASRAGISPHVYHLDQERGVILMDYINDATTISIKQAQQPDTIHTMALSLRLAHAIPKVTCPINRLIDDVHDHFSTLNKFGLVNESMSLIMQKIEHLFAKLDALQYPRKMIHGDLHGKNIFLTQEGSILFIDWEGARYDDPFFDIARSACTLNFNQKQEYDYLSAYLGHQAGKFEWQHYRLCKNITVLAFHFELLKFAYAMNDNKPFINIQKQEQEWAWYMERFVESSEKPSAEFIYNWAKSVLKLYDSYS